MPVPRRRSTHSRQPLPALACALSPARTAYRQARIHVFLLPGQAIVTELVHLIEVNLTDMCTFASSRQPGTWRLTKRSPVPYDIARAQKTAQRRTGR